MAKDRALLKRLVADRNTPAKVVWRAQIVLATGDGDSVKPRSTTTSCAITVAFADGPGNRSSVHRLNLG